MRKKYTMDEKLIYCAKHLQEFIKRNGDLWTKELSNAKSGYDALLTKSKRFFTRQIFYANVGAGGVLNTMADKIYMVNSCLNFTGKTLYDHIKSPQLLGEFFMDSLMGYYTPKNPYVLDTDSIIDWTKMSSKQVLIPNQAGIFPVNQWLSYYTSSSTSSKSVERVTSASKYRYLNEIDNYYNLKGKLTIVNKNTGVPLTESELNQLFQVPDGFSAWEMEKYGAISYKEKQNLMLNESLIEPPLKNEPATLVAFMK